MPKDGLNLQQWLSATPVRNAAVRSETSGEALLLCVPLQRRWWMAGPVSWCLPIRREKRLALDALGREVWTACDGEQTIEQIVEQFADRHALSFHEARLSVSQFLQMLVGRHLMVLVGHEDSPSITRETDASMLPVGAAS